MRGMRDMESLYQQYYQDVFRFLRGLSADEMLAEELTQETFFRAFKAINRFKGNSDIRVWLCSIAKNQYFTYLRKRKRLAESDLNEYEAAIWSLLVASGYLKILDYEHLEKIGRGRKPEYELALTNGEVRYMFEEMVSGWFKPAKPSYNGFLKSMLASETCANFLQKP